MSIFTKKKIPTKHKTIKLPLLSKEDVISKEIVKRGPGASTILERSVRKINRFNDMVNLFEKKTFSCNLKGIYRDIIEAERLTTDIEEHIREPQIPKGSLAKYYSTLERYQNSINFIENKCKCKPT